MTKRSYGLDLLRIVSMMGIIGLHIVNFGGIYANAGICIQNYYDILNIMFYCSVNVFAMLTGYLYCEKESINNKNIINLIFIVVFYCITILIFFKIFLPEMFIDKFMYIKAIFPPIDGRYWYIVSYVFVFFMMPYINKLLKNITREQHKKLIILLILFLSIVTTFGFKDYFKIEYGWSPFWIIVCYIIGSYIKKYIEKLKYSKILYLIIFIANVLGVFISKYIIEILTIKFVGHATALSTFLNYTSPIILGNAIILLLLFKDVRLENFVAQKIIISLSNAAFGVYIIHCNILIFDYILKGNLGFISNRYAMINIVLVIVGVYLLCWLIDSIRKRLFKVTGLDRLGAKIGNFLNKKIVDFYMKIKSNLEDYLL